MKTPSSCVRVHGYVPCRGRLPPRTREIAPFRSLKTNFPSAGSGRSGAVDRWHWPGPGGPGGLAAAGQRIGRISGTASLRGLHRPGGGNMDRVAAVSRGPQRPGADPRSEGMDELAGQDAKQNVNDKSMSNETERDVSPKVKLRGAFVRRPRVTQCGKYNRGVRYTTGRPGPCGGSPENPARAGGSMPDIGSGVSAMLRRRIQYRELPRWNPGATRRS